MMLQKMSSIIKIKKVDEKEEMLSPEKKEENAKIKE
jgi:hypothetical protein